jgi:hypothetical protein
MPKKRITRAAQRVARTNLSVARKVWIVRTDESAAKLAPIIKALQAKGITSLTSRGRHPFDRAALVVASEAEVVKTVPPLERADDSLRRFVELRDVR